MLLIEVSKFYVYIQNKRMRIILKEIRNLCYIVEIVYINNMFRRSAQSNNKCFYCVGVFVFISNGCKSYRAGIQKPELWRLKENVPNERGAGE